MIKPPDNWMPFSSPEEKLAYLKAHKLTPPSYDEPKQLYYEGIYSDGVQKCDAVGFVDSTTVVIRIGSELHCIHPDHLLEMQAGKSTMTKTEQIMTQSSLFGADGHYFVFDVETPNGKNDRICAIGIALVDHGSITECKEYFVNPETSFYYKNIQLTGITEATVKDAPTFPVVWEEIEKLAAGRTFVAHNAQFDLSVLEKTASAYHIELPPVEYLCTLELARILMPSLPHGLKDLCYHYGIPLNHHQAASDAAACAKILLQFALNNADLSSYVKSYQFSLLPQEPCKAQDPKHKAETFDPAAYSCCTESSISVTGKLVCLTGDFQRGARKKVEAELEQLGAVIKKGISKKLDYLIVGCRGSDSWITDQYGTKIKKAKELQEAGAGVQIVNEDDFFSVLDRTPVPKQETLPEEGEEGTDADSEQITDAISDEMRALAADFIQALDSFDLNYDTTTVKAEHVITPKSGEYDRLRVVIEKTDWRKGKVQPLFRFSGKQKVWVWFPNFICAIFTTAGISFERPDTDLWGRILLKDVPSFDAHKEVAQQIFEEAIQGNSFDCCSRYMGCSNAKKCIHPDIMMASQCTYRQRLNAGRIFYGENRNV